MKHLITIFLPIVLSALAIAAYDLLPMRSLPLIMGGAPEQKNVTLFADNSGATHAFWVDKTKSRLRCTYSSQARAGNAYCGLDITLGNGLDTGLDLSVYESISLKMSYTGKAKVLRLFIRHAMTGLPQRLKKANSQFKYNNVFLPANELDTTLTIQLSELSVAEWWLRSARLPRQYSYPDFSNATNLGVDVPFPAPVGEHDLSVTKITLNGHYISRENWYLCIMGLWFCILIARGIYYYVILRRQSISNSFQLEKALDKSRSLELESMRYKELSLTDPLTGVFNRRGIKQLGEHIHASHINQPFDCCLVMVDVDHFKKINDQFGHDIGDEVLQKIANALSKGTRNLDKVGRWGGEEFLILCPNTDTSQALRLTEHIRKDISRITLANSDKTITASFGIAALNGTSLEQSIKNADKALYDAKQQGRNRSCIYSDN